MVEAIAPEELEPMNDSTCKHERAERDWNETDFIAFKCSNPECGEVALFPKE